MNKHVAVLLLTSLFSLAMQPVAADSTESADAGAVILESIRSRLLSARPDLPLEVVSKSEFSSLYQVKLLNGQMLYTDKDAEFLMSGKLYKVTSDGFVSTTAHVENEIRMAKIAALDEDQMVIFSPENPKTTITVFTDSDCTYCRKLHRDVPTLNKMGIAVRYLAYPRTGLGSPTHQKMVSAWCADDKMDAMNKIKSGIAIRAKTCKNPVAQQYILGQELGVTGTPAIVLEDGRLIPGYLEPPRMAQALGLN